MSKLLYEMSMANTDARMKVRVKLLELGLESDAIRSFDGNRLQADLTDAQVKTLRGAFDEVVLQDFHVVLNATHDMTSGPRKAPPTLAELGVVAPDKSKLN
ncbi:MAG: hypothetical protein EON60_02595 [Alphaproteobacteria bacterium]|nr:MAG: hypothetical protein EON60_02595 [Alphaproteobacteria bacterium]